MVAMASSSSRWVQRPSRTGLRGLMFWVFQWVRSRTAAMVGLVVPIRRPIWASDRSGNCLTSQAMASGLSPRLVTGV